MEQQNSLKPSFYKRVLEDLLSIQNKFYSEPERYINSKTSFEKKQIEEKIYGILVFFSAAIQTYRSNNVFQSTNIFRTPRRKQKFVQKKPLCVTNVNLDQIFIQLCDLMDPHLDNLKQISFFYINNFNKSNSAFSFLKEAESGKDENNSFVSQSSENDSDKDVDGENHSNAVEKSTNGTQHDEETDFFLQYPDGEKQKRSAEDLFDMNEMNKFVEQGENMDFDEESLLEECNTKFCDKKDQALDKLLDEYEEKNGELSKHSQKSGDDDDSTNDNERDFDADDSDEDMHTLENVHQNIKDFSKLSKESATSTIKEQDKEESHLLHLVKKNDILNNLLDTTERELVGDKHWTMKGEVSGKTRDQNSLLEVHLDIPLYNHHYQSEDVLGINEFPWNNEEPYEDQNNSLTLKESETPSYSSLSAEIEKIVLHRIRYLLFDDVVKKYEKPIAETGKNHNDLEVEVLNFQKNQNGLADVYADYYTKQVLNGVTSADVKLNEKCTQMTHLFNTIMYKLDALSSHRVMRKPVIHRGQIPDNIPSIIVEDTIPAVVSDNQRKAPQEIFEPGTLKKREEMTQEEKKSARRLHKARRKNRLHNLLMTGQTTLQQNIKKSIDLRRKNRDEKQKRERTKNTGIATEMQQSKLSRTKRLRTADFIINAAKST